MLICTVMKNFNALTGPADYTIQAVRVLLYPRI